MKCDVCKKEYDVRLLNHVKGLGRIGQHEYEELDFYLCKTCHANVTEGMIEMCSIRSSKETSDYLKPDFTSKNGE